MTKIRYRPSGGILGNTWCAHALHLRHLPKVATLTSSQTFRDTPETLEGSDPDVEARIREKALASTPVVIKGMARTGDSSPWDWKKLRSKYGDSKVTVQVANFAHASARSLPIALGEFIDHIAFGHPFRYASEMTPGLGPYASNQRIPELEPIAPRSRLFEDQEPESTWWIGTDGAVTAPHAHGCHDVLSFQLIGSRTWYLIPPHESVHIGAIAFNPNFIATGFDPTKPDPEKFPAHDRIKVLRFTIEAGDALLIPGFWFHGVGLSGASMSVSHFSARMPLSIGGEPTTEWVKKNRFRARFGTPLWLVSTIDDLLNRPPKSR